MLSAEIFTHHAKRLLWTAERKNEFDFFSVYSNIFKIHEVFIIYL